MVGKRASTEAYEATQQTLPAASSEPTIPVDETNDTQGGAHEPSGQVTTTGPVVGEVSEEELFASLDIESPEEGPWLEALIDQFHLMDQSTGPRTTEAQLKRFMNMAREAGLLGKSRRASLREFLGTLRRSSS